MEEGQEEVVIKDFLVWAPEHVPQKGAEIVLTALPAFAAEAWAKDKYSVLDFPDEVEVYVRDEDGTVTIWTVTCKAVVKCTATEKERAK